MLPPRVRDDFLFGKNKKIIPPRTRAGFFRRRHRQIPPQKKKKKAATKKKSSTRAYNLVCITPIYFELTETQAGNDKMDNSTSYIYMLYVRLQNRFHITSMVIAETTAE